MIDFADIVPALSFVRDKGLVQSASDYRPQEFGDVSIVLVGTPFSLRIERDRGQVFLDAGNQSAGWYKLEFILEFVDNSVTQHQLGEPPDPAAMAKLLRTNWDKVARLFGDQQEVWQLQRFAKQKSADLLSRLFRKP